MDKRLDKKYTKEWFILLGLLLGVTVTNGFARFAYGLLLPAIQTEMDWNYAQAGWLSTVNALGYIVGAISTMILVQKFASEKLFAFGLITTSVVLLMTGVLPTLEAQYALRFFAGTFGAVSFSTAGAIASGLFKENARLNALSIAILFGTGGGFGIILAGAFIPTLIDVVGNSAWPICWIIIGLFSMVFTPFGIWSALQIESSKPSRLTRNEFRLLKMLPELVGYACFGFGYIVYLTFLSAWMTAQSIDATMITTIWVILGLCICISPFLWRPIFARFGNGIPLAMVLSSIAFGSVVPLLSPAFSILILSAVIFGSSVFMAPGAITNFTRKNLPQEMWAYSISIFTVLFAISQTLGPYVAGLIGDYFDNIGMGLVTAFTILLLGALVSLSQKELNKN